MTTENEKAVRAPMREALQLAHDHMRLHIPQYSPGWNVHDTVVAALQSQVSNTDGWVMVPPGLIETLRDHQRQIDEDGTEVGVNRQAVDEAVKILEAAAPKAPQQVSNTPQDGNESQYLVTLDRRDLFDAIRGAIKEALLRGDTLDDEDVAILNEEACLRAVNCLKPLYLAPPQQQEQSGEAVALPERDVSKPAEQQGVFRKFEVYRVDGSDQPGGKHHGCEYFVLDVTHDQHAKAALAAYAEACKETHPELSRDMIERYGLTSPAKPTDSEGQADTPSQVSLGTPQEAVKWWNGCDESVPRALRFLAEHDRPSGGEHSAHLHQLAGEIERMASRPMYLAPPTVDAAVEAFSQVSRAEYEALRRDAERYRWLRTHPAMRFIALGEYWKMNDISDEQFDAAIDAASNGEGGE